MKKKLNFLISVILVAIIAFGAFSMPAASFETDVKMTSSAMLLINLDTDTVCYSVEPDRKRYASCMSELMTFIVAQEMSEAPETVSVGVRQDFIDSLPYSDGALAAYVGETLTLKDLMAIMLLGSGSDAAYLIADTLCGGNVDQFVDKMNKKAAQLGCDRSHFVTPGYSDSDQHYTTCRDIYKMYKRLDKLDLYHELIKEPTYIPPQLADEGEQTAENSGRTAQSGSRLREQYQVITQNSLMNPSSPYYFRYTTGGKYSNDPTAKANYMVTTTYHNMSYIFVAMHGKDASEENVFSDGRRLIIWAYLNLSDRKVIDANNAISDYHVVADWGEYDVGLYASNSAYKTLPTKYEEEKFSYKIDIPSQTALPVFAGQSIGTAKIYYDGEKIEEVNLVSSSDEGVSLLGDLSRFGTHALSEILSNSPSAGARDQTSADAEVSE